MSEIQPFRAIRYATDVVGRDLSSRLSPPYDVLDAADKKRLLQRDPYNFVAIDLPHVPAKAAGPPEVYDQARTTYQQWLDRGILIRDLRPALYLYHQRYTHAGKTYTRRKFFARLRLEPFGAGSVFPHEQTFGGPKEDRLCLTRAVQANLSPIFALYSDPENRVIERLETARPPEPLAIGTLDGVENELWAIHDPDAIAEVRGLLADRPVFIADGHHRYGTALLYRDELRQAHGELPEAHPAHFVLTVLCGMEDPGLLILPTHRVLSGVTGVAELLARDDALRLEPLTVVDPEHVPQQLADFGPQAVALFEAGRWYVVRPVREDLLDALEPGHAPAWRRLALAVLHAYLIDRRIVPDLLNGKRPSIEYVKSAAGAVEKATASAGCAVLLQPTTMDELRAVCQAGDLMPQKSTFFYPKLASGLVIHSLRD